MTVANLFAQHRAGKVSKEKFLYEVRRDAQLPFISNLTSYEDAIKILKQKGVIKEAQETSKSLLNEQEDLYHQIDRLNPILVKKAVNMELAKLPMINAEIYQKTTEKVVKKLQKDPRAYDEVLVSNAKEIHKVDEKLKMTQVKGELKDPHNQMKSPKGLEKPKTNVKASKTENKKGKPKGVKEMKGSKKGHGGIKQMENPGTKETVLESLLSFMFKKKLNEDTHHEYGVGHGVQVPEGKGVIEGLVGDTATIAFEDGSKKDYQINALRHYAEEAKKPVEEKTPEVEEKQSSIKEYSKDELPKSEKLLKLYKYLQNQTKYFNDAYVETQKDVNGKDYLMFSTRRSLNGKSISDVGRFNDFYISLKKSFSKYFNINLEKVDDWMTIYIIEKDVKEAITAKTTDASHNQDVYTKINKIPGQARTDIKKAYDSGKTIDI